MNPVMRQRFRGSPKPDSIPQSTDSEAAMSQIDLRHGIFLPPFHPNEENPTACLGRDLDLIVHLDKLGFQEAWIGEHHSAGYEIISSPEIFIAFAAERTRHIRLGTGVISLPYHHPMMTADRIVQLDHMTRGRVMFGAGPGLLASDAIMMGIDPMTQRDRMAEALDAIASNWQIACDVAAEHGRTMDPNRLRLVGPMHIAETRQKAFENARWGFERYLGYLNNNQPRFIVPKGDDPLEWFVENKYGVCGTPDDAIALIERLQTKQGEFGVFLQQAHNWADFEATKRSYELYARYVMPHFSNANRPREASFQWCGDNRAEFSAKRQAAAKAMFDKHEAEQRERAQPTAARPSRGREAW